MLYSINMISHQKSHFIFLFLFFRILFASLFSFRTYKEKPQTVSKYLIYVFLTQDLYLEYINNSPT